MAANCLFKNILRPRAMQDRAFLMEREHQA
jgi:hypothetical protein